MACAAAVLSPELSVVLIPMSCARMSRESCRVPLSICADREMQTKKRAGNRSTLDCKMGNMRSISLRVLVCASVALFAFGAATGDKPTTQATILDHNEFPCDNCLFGMGDYYFCFDAGQKILIGHEKVRTQTRKKNPVDLMQRGKQVPVRFDDKFIWVSEPNGKELKLTQDYTKKIFLDSDKCQAAVK